jgi:hypothetical protein
VRAYAVVDTRPTTSIASLPAFPAPPAPPKLVTVGNRDRAYIAVGDLDGDGEPDVVAATLDDILYFRGMPDGSLVLRERVPQGRARFERVAIGDLDGDRALDVVMFGRDPIGDNTVWIRYGRGAGGLDPPVALGGGVDGKELAIADVTGDGRLDIITGNIVKNVGGRRWEIIRGTAVSGDMRIADLDGDGRLDFVGPHDHGIEIVRTDGAGHAIDDMRFSLAPGLITVLNTGIWTSKTWTSSYEDTAVGDLNRDGLSDLVVTTQSDLSIYFGRCRRTP